MGANGRDAMRRRSLVVLAEGWARSLLLCLALLACSSEEHPACEETTSVVDGLNGQSGFGFSLGSALEALASYDGRLTWRSGAEWLSQAPKDATTLLSLRVTYESAPIEQVSTRRGDVETDDPTFCANHLRSQGKVGLLSTDGALDEQLDVQIRAFENGLVKLRGTLAQGTLRGTLSLEPSSPIEFYYGAEQGEPGGSLLVSSTDAASSNGMKVRAATIASWSSAPSE